MGRSACSSPRSESTVPVPIRQPAADQPAAAKQPTLSLPPNNTHTPTPGPLTQVIPPGWHPDHGAAERVGVTARCQLRRCAAQHAGPGGQRVRAVVVEAVEEPHPHVDLVPGQRGGGGPDGRACGRERRRSGTQCAARGSQTPSVSRQEEERMVLGAGCDGIARSAVSLAHLQ